MSFIWDSISAVLSGPKTPATSSGNNEKENSPTDIADRMEPYDGHSEDEYDTNIAQSIDKAEKTLSALNDMNSDNEIGISSKGQSLVSQDDNVDESSVQDDTSSIEANMPRSRRTRTATRTLPWKTPTIKIKEKNEVVTKDEYLFRGKLLEDLEDLRLRLCLKQLNCPVTKKTKRGEMIKKLQNAMENGGVINHPQYSIRKSLTIPSSPSELFTDGLKYELRSAQKPKQPLANTTKADNADTKTKKSRKGRKTITQPQESISSQQSESIDSIKISQSSEKDAQNNISRLPKSPNTSSSRTLSIPYSLSDSRGPLISKDRLSSPLKSPVIRKETLVAASVVPAAVGLLTRSAVKRRIEGDESSDKQQATKKSRGSPGKVVKIYRHSGHLIGKSFQESLSPQQNRSQTIFDNLENKAPSNENRLNNISEDENIPRFSLDVLANASADVKLNKNDSIQMIIDNPQITEDQNMDVDQNNDDSANQNEFIEEDRADNTVYEDTQMTEEVVDDQNDDLNHSDQDLLEVEPSESAGNYKDVMVTGNSVSSINEIDEETKMSGDEKDAHVLDQETTHEATYGTEETSIHENNDSGNETDESGNRMDHENEGEDDEESDDESYHSVGGQDESSDDDETDAKSVPDNTQSEDMNEEYSSIASSTRQSSEGAKFPSFMEIIAAQKSQNPSIALSSSNGITDKSSVIEICDDDASSSYVDADSMAVIARTSSSSNVSQSIEPQSNASIASDVSALQSPTPMLQQMTDAASAIATGVFNKLVQNGKLLALVTGAPLPNDSTRLNEYEYSLFHKLLESSKPLSLISQVQPKMLLENDNSTTVSTALTVAESTAQSSHPEKDASKESAKSIEVKSVRMQEEPEIIGDKLDRESISPSAMSPSNDDNFGKSWLPGRNSIGATPFRYSNTRSNDSIATRKHTVTFDESLDVEVKSQERKRVRIWDPVEDIDTQATSSIIFAATPRGPFSRRTSIGATPFYKETPLPITSNAGRTPFRSSNHTKNLFPTDDPIMDKLPQKSLQKAEIIEPFGISNKFRSSNSSDIRYVPTFQDSSFRFSDQSTHKSILSRPTSKETEGKPLTFLQRRRLQKQAEVTATPASTVAKRILETLSELSSPPQIEKRTQPNKSHVSWKETTETQTFIEQPVFPISNRDVPKKEDLKISNEKSVPTSSSSTAFTSTVPIQKNDDKLLEATLNNLEYSFSAPTNVISEVSTLSNIDISGIKYSFTAPGSAELREQHKLIEPSQDLVQESVKKVSDSVTKSVSASSETKEVKSNVNIWKIATDKIKCQVCLVPNEKTATKCVSCENPLSGTSSSDTTSKSGSAAVDTSGWGAPPTTTASKFTFGVPAAPVDSKPASSTFTFGSTGSTSNTASFSTATDIATKTFPSESSTKEDSSKPVVPLSLTFGGAPPKPAEKTAPAFSFGTSAPVSQNLDQKNSLEKKSEPFVAFPEMKPSVAPTSVDMIFDSSSQHNKRSRDSGNEENDRNKKISFTSSDSLGKGVTEPAKNVPFTFGSSSTTDNTPAFGGFPPPVATTTATSTGTTALPISMGFQFGKSSDPVTTSSNSLSMSKPPKETPFVFGSTLEKSDSVATKPSLPIANFAFPADAPKPVTTQEPEKKTEISSTPFTFGSVKTSTLPSAPFSLPSMPLSQMSTQPLGSQPNAKEASASTGQGAVVSTGIVFGKSTAASVPSMPRPSSPQQTPQVSSFSYIPDSPGSTMDTSEPITTTQLATTTSLPTFGATFPSQPPNLNTNAPFSFGGNTAATPAFTFGQSNASSTSLNLSNPPGPFGGGFGGNVSTSIATPFSGGSVTFGAKPSFESNQVNLNSNPGSNLFGTTSTPFGSQPTATNLGPFSTPNQSFGGFPPAATNSAATNDGFGFSLGGETKRKIVKAKRK